MRTLKLLICISLLLCFTSSVYSQNKCTLKPSDAPKLWGFELGMTSAQIKERYPDVQFNKKDEFGYMNGIAFPSVGNRSKANPQFDLNGVVSANMDFVDDRLALVIVIFDLQTTFPDVESYAHTVSRWYALPDVWEVNPRVENGMILKCDGFRMQAATAGYPVLVLSHDDLNKTLHSRWKDTKDHPNRLPGVSY